VNGEKTIPPRRLRPPPWDEDGSSHGMQVPAYACLRQADRIFHMSQALSIALQQATGVPECLIEIAQAHRRFVLHVHL
jgi:hypothetical protein